MTRLTKRAKLDGYDKLSRKHDLLERYFWDSRICLKPDAVYRDKTVHGDRCKLSVYGSKRADGGYLVIEWNPGTPTIIYWEQWQDAVRSMVQCSGECEYLYKRAEEVLSRELRRSKPELTLGENGLVIEVMADSQ